MNHKVNLSVLRNLTDDELRHTLQTLIDSGQGVHLRGEALQIILDRWDPIETDVYQDACDEWFEKGYNEAADELEEAKKRIDELTAELDKLTAATS